jgi:Domain of unknown function (DUF4169)
VAEIVNLRQRRKQKARAAADASAATNRVKFGRPKAARALDKAEAERARAELDHKKLTEPWSD